MRLGLFTNKLRLILKKPLQLLVFITFPVLLSVLIASFFQETAKQGAIPIAIVDQDQTNYSELIYNRMKERESIEMIEFDEASAMRALKRGEVDTVFIIKESFEQQLLADNREHVVELWSTPLSMATGIVKEMMASEITRLTSNIKAGNWVTGYFTKKKRLNDAQKEDLWLNAYNYTDEQWHPQPLMTVHYEKASEVATERVKTTASFNGYLGLWSFFTMLACFVLTEPLIRERKSIFVRMRTMYKSVGSYLVQTGMAYFLILLFQAIISLTILKYLNLTVIDGNVLWNILFFLSFCITISIGLASHLTHIGLYYGAGMVLVFGTSLVSGVFFPISDLNENISIVSSYLPQTWLMSGEQNHLVVYFVFCFVIWGMSIWKLERVDD